MQEENTWFGPSDFLIVSGGHIWKVHLTANHHQVYPETIRNTHTRNTFKAGHEKETKEQAPTAGFKFRFHWEMWEETWIVNVDCSIENL